MFLFFVKVSKRNPPPAQLWQQLRLVFGSQRDLELKIVIFLKYFCHLALTETEQCVWLGQDSRKLLTGSCTQVSSQTALAPRLTSPHLTSPYHALPSFAACPFSKVQPNAPLELWHLLFMSVPGCASQLSWKNMCSYNFGAWVACPKARSTASLALFFYLPRGRPRGKRSKWQTATCNLQLASGKWRVNEPPVALTIAFW